MLVLLEAQEENWDELDLMVRAFQQTTMALRYAGVPVIVAPAGLDARRRLRDRAARATASKRRRDLSRAGRGGRRPDSGRRRHQGNGCARGRADAAREHGLPPIDPARVRDDRLREDVGQRSGCDSARLPAAGRCRHDEPRAADQRCEGTRARARARGLHRPRTRTAIAVGGESVAATLKLGVHLAWRAGRISDHDKLIGRKLATIMTEGDLPHATTVSEQHLLDLEREAFLQSAGGAQDAGADSAHAEDRQAVAGTRNVNIMRLRGSGRASRAGPGHPGPVGVDAPAVDALCGAVSASSRSRSPTNRRAARPSTSLRLRLLRAADRRGAWMPPASQSAIICGISYGGLIAAAFAARHPERTRAVGRRLGHSAVLAA